MQEGRPRERRHARKRQDILATALQIVINQGPAALSIRRIAELIDYSPSGLYEYFSSKEEILNAISDEGFKLLNADLSRISAELLPSDRLMQMGIAYITFAHKHQEQYFLMFGSGSYQHLSLQDFRQSEIYNQLKQVISAGIARQEFSIYRGHGLEELTYHYWVQLHGIAMLPLAHLEEDQLEIDTLNQYILAKMVAFCQKNLPQQ